LVLFITHLFADGGEIYRVLDQREITGGDLFGDGQREEAIGVFLRDLAVEIVEDTSKAVRRRTLRDGAGVFLALFERSTRPETWPCAGAYCSTICRGVVEFAPW
jgi:hypothetical protein